MIEPSLITLLEHLAIIYLGKYFYIQ